jgi:hypothetical protein
MFTNKMHIMISTTKYQPDQSPQTTIVTIKNITTNNYYQEKQCTYKRNTEVRSSNH